MKKIVAATLQKFQLRNGPPATRWPLTLTKIEVMSGLDGFKENFVVHCCDKLSCQATRRESGVEEIEIGPG